MRPAAAPDHNQSVRLEPDFRRFQQLSDRLRVPKWAGKQHCWISGRTAERQRLWRSMLTPDTPVGFMRAVGRISFARQRIVSGLAKVIKARAVRKTDLANCVQPE